MYDISKTGKCSCPFLASLATLLLCFLLIADKDACCFQSKKECQGCLMCPFFGNRNVFQSSMRARDGCEFLGAPGNLITQITQLFVSEVRNVCGMLCALL